LLDFEGRNPVDSPRKVAWCEYSPALSKLDLSLERFLCPHVEDGPIENEIASFDEFA